jgi:hypothetical protein
MVSRCRIISALLTLVVGSSVGFGQSDVQPNDPGSPVLNTHPKHALRLAIELPSTLRPAVKLYAVYGSNPYGSHAPCAKRIPGGGYVPLRVQVPVKTSDTGVPDHFSATVFLDRFRESPCGWGFSGLVVTDAGPEVPEPVPNIAYYPNVDSHASDRADVWCLRTSPTSRSCASLEVLGRRYGLSSDLVTRGNAVETSGHQRVGPATKRLRIVVHDVNRILGRDTINPE